MSQSIGIVTAKEVNQNNKQKIRIDSDWYFAGNTDVSQLNVGQRISFDWNTFGAQNNLRGLQAWGLTPDQPTPEEVAAAKPQERKPWAGKPGGGGFARGQDRGLEIDLQCMRFVGQVVGSAIEAKQILHEDNIAGWVTKAYDAIKFAKSWGATAPAPVQAATSAGPPKQTPQGSTPPGPVRPTGNFGWGEKCRNIPWNVMEKGKLEWFIDKSTAPSDIKTKCKDELYFRELDAQRATALAPQQDPPDDFDDQIPF